MALEALSEWINPFYLQKEIVDQVAEVFREGIPQSVQLQQFLNPEKFEEVKKLKFKESYDPIKHKYGESEVSKDFVNFLMSEAFGAYLELITGYNEVTVDKAMEFKQGDYTVLHDSIRMRDLRLLLSLDEWDVSCGGMPTYKAEENVLEVQPQANSLNIVNCSQAQEFISYVNHHAKGSVRFIAATARKE